jgi:hypothetical protein
MWFSSLKKMFDKLVLLFSVLKLFYLVENIKNLFCLKTKKKSKKKNKGVPVKELPLY